jgi:hypothetical protein
MPRYLVERTLTAGRHISIKDTSAPAVADNVAINAEHRVTWVRSHVLQDHAKTVRVHDRPSPGAIRPVAERPAHGSTPPSTVAGWTRTSTPNSRPQPTPGSRPTPGSLPTPLSLPTPMLASRITARKVVTGTSVLAGGLLAAALAAVLIGPASPAAARQVDPPLPTTGYNECAVEMPAVSQPGVAPASPPLADPLPPIVVCTLEVAVPTPISPADRATEMVNLGVAAVFGATLAAAATAIRRRPPRPAGPPGELLDDTHRLIDITNTVQSQPHENPAVLTLSGRYRFDGDEHHASRPYDRPCSRTSRR